MMKTMANSTQIRMDLHQIFFKSSSIPIFISSILTLFYNTLTIAISTTISLFNKFDPSILLNYYNNLVLSIRDLAFSCISVITLYLTHFDPSVLSNYYDTLRYTLKYISSSISATIAPPLAAALAVVIVYFCLRVGFLWLLRMVVITCWRIISFTCGLVLWGIRRITCQHVTATCESGKMMKAPGSGGRRMERSDFEASPKAYFTGLRAGSQVMRAKLKVGSNRHT